ncbi:MAG: inositol monophosphatase [Alphaproteobacteria bacterium]|nr:inositol monophosphatase [Alphaproteobacteria bacterium]
MPDQFSPAERDELLALAVAAAAEAGLALKQHRPVWSTVDAELGREVKIAADQRAEAMILERLSSSAPFPILSEETGWSAGRDLKTFWAVDPLDGSVNYLQGYPHCAVSIALMHDGAAVLGVVDCFLLEERFTGAVGAGAQLNGAPIRVSRTHDPARGVLNTGIPARMATDAAARDAMMTRIMQWRKVRMIGSAASALAYVAAGRADAYRESGAMLWDVAGGCALVTAAGGTASLSGLEGPLEVAATNGVVAVPA